jgi:hypothetical protein
MKPKSTPRTSRIKVTDDIRRAYEERDRSLDNDRDAPAMPPEFWANAKVGKYYRPLGSGNNHAEPPGVRKSKINDSLVRVARVLGMWQNCEYARWIRSRFGDSTGDML